MRKECTVRLRGYCMLFVISTIIYSTFGADRRLGSHYGRSTQGPLHWVESPTKVQVSCNTACNEADGVEQNARCLSAPQCS
jgi:hypothetical protein